MLALLVPSASPAAACGWLWECASAPPGYGYVPHSSYVPGSPAWAYRYYRPYRNGDSTPGWAYGYIYASRPSVTIAPSPWYLDTALSVPEAGTVGLRAPVTSALGLQESGLPANGPSLFGPSPPPPAWGYRNGHLYRPPSSFNYGTYGYRTYYFYGASDAYAPPRDTASWWLEPRRRR